MERASKPHKIVYTVVERQRDKKKFWLRVGAAFTNQDGSLNVLLDAIPTNGTLQIRDPDPADGRRRDAGEAGEPFGRALAAAS